MSGRPVDGMVGTGALLDDDLNAFLSPCKQYVWAEDETAEDTMQTSLSCAFQSKITSGKWHRLPYQSSVSNTTEMQGDNFMSYESCTGWADLPADVLSKIMEYLPNSSHRVLRATCCGWSKAIGSGYKYLKPDSVKSQGFVRRFPSLRTLDVSSADTKVVCNWDNSMELVSDVEDDDLEFIPHLQRLSMVYLTNCVGLNGLFMEYASQLSHLKLLDLSGCSSLKNEYFIYFIPRFTRLESISLVGCEDLDDCAIEAAVDSLRHLTRFAVPPSTTDAGLHFLVRSKSLRRIGFRCCDNITPEGLKIFLHMSPDIERVVVSKCRKISSSTLNGNSGGIHEFDSKSSDRTYDQTEQNNCFFKNMRRRSLNMELMMEYFYN